MTDYSEEFDRLRRNRVELSHIKYGSARINFGGGRVDALKTAEDCLEAFKRDKNTEHLVDAANYLICTPTPENTSAPPTAAKA